MKSARFLITCLVALAAPAMLAACQPTVSHRGYMAKPGAFDQIDIRGTNSQSLKEKWAEQPVTFLGILVDGFPNFQIEERDLPETDPLKLEIASFVDCVRTGVKVRAGQRLLAFDEITGDKLFVEGRIEYRQYQDKENQTKYVTEINVREIILLGGRGGGGGVDFDRPGAPLRRVHQQHGFPRHAHGASCLHAHGDDGIMHRTR